jgi:hypothetical protein
VTDPDGGMIGAFEPNVKLLTPLTKPVPVIVNWNAAPPAAALAGESEVTVGNGLLIAKGKVPEAPPPGAGLLTETLIVAPVAMSVDGICTVIVVAVIDVGTKLVNAPKLTVAPATKFVPVIVSVNAAPPAAAFAGESNVIVGVELSTVNVSGPLVPPPGVAFVTVTLTGPAAARSPAGTVTVSVVPPLPTVPPVILLLPKFTVELATKPVPVNTNEGTAWPNVPVVGEMAVSVGDGLLTVNVCARLVPPPGAGFITDTLTGPAVVICEAGIVIVRVFPPVPRVAPESWLAPKLTIEPAMKFVPVSVKFTD